MKRVAIEADQDATVADGDRGGDRAALANGRLRRARDLDVLRIRQAVADERRFEGDHRHAVAQGVRDLGRDQQAVGCHARSVAERDDCRTAQRTAPNPTRLGT